MGLWELDRQKYKPEVVSIKCGVRRVGSVACDGAAFRGKVRLFRDKTLQRCATGDTRGTFCTSVGKAGGCRMRICLSRCTRVSSCCYSYPTFRDCPKPYGRIITFLLTVLGSSSSCEGRQGATDGPATVTGGSDDCSIRRAGHLLSILRFRLLRRGGLFSEIPVRIRCAVIVSSLHCNRRCDLGVQMNTKRFCLIGSYSCIVGYVLIKGRLPFKGGFAFSPSGRRLSTRSHTVFLLLGRVVSTSTASTHSCQSDRSHGRVAVPTDVIGGLLRGLTGYPLIFVGAGPCRARKETLLPRRLIRSFSRLPVDFTLDRLPGKKLLFRRAARISSRGVFFGRTSVFLVSKGFCFLARDVGSHLGDVCATVSRSKRRNLRVTPSSTNSFLTVTIPTLRGLIAVSLTRSIRSACRHFPLGTRLCLS